MVIPNLKQIKVTSEQDLRRCLSKADADAHELMLVTHTKAGGDKYVSHETVHDALGEFGWTPGMRYTLNATLIGHAISR